MSVLVAAGLMLAGAPASAVDLAAAFGAREGVREVSLSPDGGQIAFQAPLVGQGSGLYVAPTDGSSPPRRIAVASGAPERLGDCAWISQERLVCTVYGVAKRSGFKVGFDKLVLVHARPGAKTTAESIGVGTLLRSPQKDEDSLLIGRLYYRQALPFAVLERVSTSNGARRTVTSYGDNSVELITDEAGEVRVIGFSVDPRYDLHGYRVDHLPRPPEGLVRDEAVRHL